MFSTQQSAKHRFTAKGAKVAKKKFLLDVSFATAISKFSRETLPARVRFG
jgi:hypothetical protein